MAGSMAMSALRAGLFATSMSSVPILSNVAQFSGGVIDIYTGSPITGAVSIVTSLVPCGAMFGEAAGKLISCTSKGSVANKILKFGAKVLGNTDHIVHGASAASSGPKYLSKFWSYLSAGNSAKAASNATKVTMQVTEVASTSAVLRKIVDYGSRLIQWGGATYLKG
jgi:hypothetical protein